MRFQEYSEHRDLIEEASTMYQAGGLFRKFMQTLGQYASKEIFSKIFSKIKEAMPIPSFEIDTSMLEAEPSDQMVQAAMRYTNSGDPRMTKWELQHYNNQLLGRKNTEDEPTRNQDFKANSKTYFSSFKWWSEHPKEQKAAYWFDYPELGAVIDAVDAVKSTNDPEAMAAAEKAIQDLPIQDLPPEILRRLTMSHGGTKAGREEMSPHLAQYGRTTADLTQARKDDPDFARRYRRYQDERRREIGPLNPIDSM